LTSGLSDRRAASPPPAPTPAVRGGTSVGAVVLLATARSAEGGPAALLPWEDGTLVSRLTGQLAALGVPRAIVVTRPDWETAVRAAVQPPVEVRSTPSLAADLELVAELAGGDDGLVVMYADMVTHGEALAGLLADPRVATGILAGGRGRPMVFRIRARRGRMISAGSPYHSVHRPTAAFLGALKVAPPDLPRLARVARDLVPLAADPPEAWLQELERKEESWRIGLARAAADADGAKDFDDADEPPEDEAEPEVVVLSDEDEARLRHRLAAAPDDAAALLLVGLVRDGAMLTGSYVRRLFWTRPLSAGAAAEAERDIATVDEDRVLLDSAVKGSDGFFTTFFVSPYSKYIARWAARRGFTPNQVTTVSVLIGLAAAIAFATGERWGLIAGAILLQLAFTTDCVDGQLARYTRTFSKLGAWLDSVFDRTKEYLAFAGLAIGASAMDDPVWLLACAAITLQTARHMSDFSFGGSQRDAISATAQPPVAQAQDAAGAAAMARRNGEAPAAAPAARSLPDRVLGAWHAIDRAAGVRWLKKMVAFPIGERFAVISITAALFTPRVTFIAVLAWGTLGTLYTLTGRVLRSLR
jgi:CTP:molybdopterin cytidylyltransferase MocA